LYAGDRRRIERTLEPDRPEPPWPGGTLAVQIDGAAAAGERCERLGWEVVAPLRAADDRRDTVERRCHPCLDVGGPKEVAQCGDRLVPVAVAVQPHVEDGRPSRRANPHAQA